MIRTMLSLAALLAFAPNLARGAEPEACPRLVAQGTPLIQRAAVTLDMARLTFEGHATFLIETARGVRAATDYNDYVRVPLPLDVVTMNKAHSTHFTTHPDPHIGQVLHGWADGGGEIQHDVRVGDLRIRNVQTNIRDWSGGTEYLGNSIFVFETGQMCIAHLGHLHHELTPEHLRKLGQIDVLLVPVDGSYTLDQAGMMNVIEKIGPRIVVPMHFFGSSTLDRFLRLAAERFDIERRETPELVVVKDELPVKTKVIVLPGH
jgi:L-ascorbate metabolism protein UlaG (beta-lactamase superfamily)